jgi:hypothetical protein
MLYYGIKSKVSVYYLISAIMSLPCVRIVCMGDKEGNQYDTRLDSSMQIVEAKMADIEFEWEKSQAESMQKAASALDTRFKTLDYLEKDTDLPTPINTVQRRFYEDKPISPETKTKVRAYNTASAKFTLLKTIREHFALQTRTNPAFTGYQRVHDALNFAVDSSICTVGVRHFSKAELDTLWALAELTNREPCQKQDCPG